MHRLARLLGVFAVLAGLLAMHGVTGGHSAMGGQVMGGQVIGGQVQPGQMSRFSSAVVLHAVSVVDRPSQPAMTSMATLCLAIRNSDVTPGLRGCATQTARGMTQRSGPDRRPARAGAVSRPPDLVAGLCVSRT